MEIAECFAHAHELGMATILWCYLRNEAFKIDGKDYHAAADLTGQANHLGVTIEADIIKQKMATNNGGYPAIGFGKTDDRVYGELVTDHPIDLVRWQVANCYMGQIPMINSGGASKGNGDLAAAVRTAVINKRAGGAGLISGRKAFQKPIAEGVELLERDPGRVPGGRRSRSPDTEPAPEAHPRHGTRTGSLRSRISRARRARGGPRRRRGAEPPRRMSGPALRPTSWRRSTTSAGRSRPPSDELKTHLRGRGIVLRSKTPELVRQEFYGEPALP